MFFFIVLAPGHTEVEWLFIIFCAKKLVVLLGAICESAQSMDRAAHSMYPYFTQESMDRTGICGSSWAIHEFCV